MIVGSILITGYILYFVIDFIREKIRQKKIDKVLQSFEEDENDNIITYEEFYNEAIKTKGYVSYEESGYIDRKKWYNDLYLKSPHWKELRKKVLANANYKCQLCGEHKSLRVHHNTYENLGHENLSDLIALCDCCHTAYHNTKKAGRN